MLESKFIDIQHSLRRSSGPDHDRGWRRIPRLLLSRSSAPFLLRDPRVHPRSVSSAHAPRVPRTLAVVLVLLSPWLLP